VNQQVAIVIVVVLVLLAVVVVGFLASRKRRTKLLKERFGPEYERVVKREGNPRKAEGVLEFREKRREKLRIIPLSETDRLQFAKRWTAVQALFVDNPKGATTEAGNLLSEVMQARGYPAGEFDQRAEDISVDHPVLVENYRVAHDIAVRHDRGQATTEDLRKALIHYRLLFDELLQPTIPERKEARG
jgi:hypothetical protein